MQLTDLKLTGAILQEVLEKGSRPFLLISSDSMAPLIRKGDEIQLEVISPEDLFVGDILVVEDDAGLLAHRYWHTFSNGEQTTLLLKGDKLREYDPLLSSENLIGRVIARRRKSRTLPIANGIGAWLNQFLFSLDRIISQSQFRMIDGHQFSRFSKASRKEAPPLANRLTSFCVYIVGYTATKIVDCLNILMYFSRKRKGS